MSSTSIARQNRRMKIKQNIVALNQGPKITTLLSSEQNCTNEKETDSDILNVHSKTANCNMNLHEMKHESYDTLSYTASCDFLNDVLSQPVRKIFIEGDRTFKEISASEIFRISQAEISVQSNNENDLSINIAFNTAKYFHSFSNFSHGLLGGMSLLYILVLLHLFSNLLVDEDTIKYFSFFSKPIHNLYNFFCIICCVSVFDRFDITNISELFKLIRKLDFKLIALLIYPICLLLSLTTANVDDKLSMPHQNATVWESLNFEEESELYYWKTLSISKCFGALLSWLVLCLDQNFNLLFIHMQSILQKKDANAIIFI